LTGLLLINDDPEHTEDILDAFVEMRKAYTAAAFNEGVSQCTILSTYLVSEDASLLLLQYCCFICTDD
jgi:hypothetical protein